MVLHDWWGHMWDGLWRKDHEVWEVRVWVLNVIWIWIYVLEIRSKFGLNVHITVKAPFGSYVRMWEDVGAVECEESKYECWITFKETCEMSSFNYSWSRNTCGAVSAHSSCISLSSPMMNLYTHSSFHSLANLGNARPPHLGPDSFSFFL